MTDRLDDARWRAAVDADAIGEADATQRALLAEHVPDDALLRAEHALLRAIADDRVPAAAGDEAAIARAVSTFVAERGDATPLQRGPSMGRRAMVLVAGLAAAAALVVAGATWWPRPAATSLLSWAHTPESPETLDAQRSTLNAQRSTLNAQRSTLNAPASPGWVLESGALAVADPTRLPLGVKTRADTPMCARHGDAQLCVDAGSELLVHDDDTHPSVELDDGSARLTSSSTPTTMQVIVAGAHVAIAPSSEVTITTTRRRWSVEVVRGRATIERDGRSVELVAGERLQSGGTSTRTVADATTMLAQARARRQAGDLEGAAAGYAQLLEAHPDSAVAASAQVSLGEIQLARGKHKAALVAFDRYLRRGGPLAEEAALGRIRALRGLGRTREVAAAIEAFERRHPKSAYLRELRTP